MFYNFEFYRDGCIKLIDVVLVILVVFIYFVFYYCVDLDLYFVDGGLVVNNLSFIGLYEVFCDMVIDFFEVKVSDVKILNVGILGEEYSFSFFSLVGKSGYLGLWGMGERLVFSVMVVN